MNFDKKMKNILSVSKDRQKSWKIGGFCKKRGSRVEAQREGNRRSSESEIEFEFIYLLMTCLSGESC